MKKLTIEQIATEENRKKRGLRDGIYDASAVAETLCVGSEGFHKSSIMRLSGTDKDKIEDFCQKHPDWCVGEAYQCYATFFLSSRPTKFTGSHDGSGFNHGSSNLLTGCPAKLLILAEDD